MRKPLYGIQAVMAAMLGFRTSHWPPEIAADVAAILADTYADGRLVDLYVRAMLHFINRISDRRMAEVIAVCLGATAFLEVLLQQAVMVGVIEPPLSMSPQEEPIEDERKAPSPQVDLLDPDGEEADE